LTSNFKQSASKAKDNKGLVEHNRLSEIWNDPGRLQRERHPDELHPVFLILMEGFDLSYRVAMPKAGALEQYAPLPLG